MRRKGTVGPSWYSDRCYGEGSACDIGPRSRVDFILDRGCSLKNGPARSSLRLFHSGETASDGPVAVVAIAILSTQWVSLRPPVVPPRANTTAGNGRKVFRATRGD